MPAKSRKPADHGSEVIQTSRYQKVTSEEPRFDCSWDNVRAEHLKLLVSAVTEAGDAVMFGTTRQGGLMFTVYTGGDRVPVYSSDLDDLDAKIQRVIDEALGALSPTARDKVVERSRAF